MPDQDLADVRIVPVERGSESCPACESTAFSWTRTVPDHEYAVKGATTYACCSRCGSIYQAPMPEVSELAAYYPDTYHTLHGDGRLQRIRDGFRVRRLRALSTGEGAILDYGCGDGSFLMRIAESMPGRQFYGYEIGERKEVSRLADGAVTIVRGDHADLLDVLPTCCLVTLNHVIEHLPDPTTIVGSLYDRLTPGGCIEGQTPNAASLEHRVFGPRWSGYHAPRHTVVFSSSGLKTILERAGFEQVETTPAFNPAGIAVSLGSACHGEGGGMIRRRGLGWTSLLGMATLLAPFDLLLGAPGIVNFSALKNGG
jgi:SAM-dependent methyltransferase